MVDRPAATAVLADLLASLAALGQSMQEKFDPHRFLDEFSARIRRLIPHDRLVVDYLDEDGATFTVFAEHATPELVLHDRHYTTDPDPGARYLVAEWSMQRVFAGEAVRVDDLRTDPSFRILNPFEERVRAAGIRAALLVPLHGAERVVGALVATSLTAHLYDESHVQAAQQVAALIGPFVHNVVLLERERRRRRRLRALDGLTRALGASLDVRDVFGRLADAVRHVLDFDIMGIGLFTSSGREVEILAEVDAATVVATPPRIPVEHFSCASETLAGRPVVIRDAPRELDPRLPGDRLIIDDGGRSVLVVPLMFGERVGGVLYFGKRRVYWYDGADVEIALGVAAQVVLALQHQRLAEEQRRRTLVEGRARQLEQRLQSLESELAERYGFDRIIGRSPAIHEALARAAKVARTDTTVLVTGESGTGKEVMARAIHHASPRAEGPFVAVNCAALPEALLESELFGHERGAFTGADRQKPGRFELAKGGTLFLDEIGELSPPVQAKLLRVLQEREFERVGGTTTLRADVRLIAASNRDLARAVAAGQFRDDLYYRLNVFTVHLPPLRERGEDVLLLADHLVRDLGARMGKGEPGLSRGARDTLLAHTWPGNVRELQNALERALILCDGGLLSAEHLGLGVGREAPAPVPAPLPAAAAAGEAAATSLPEWERRMVTEALARAKGNKSQAAKLLGLSRSQLYTRLKRFGQDAGADPV